MDQSLSKSIGDMAGVGTRTLLVRGKYAPIDILFPLFDQMSQITKIPRIISGIFGIFYTIQILLTCFWPATKMWVDNSAFDERAISLICQIFWFTDPQPSTTSFAISFSIIFAISIFMFCWFIGIISFYVKNLRFRTWCLYVSRYIIEIISPLLLYPAASLFGTSIWLLIDTESTGHWGFIIFSFVSLTIIFTIAYFGNSILSRSCCVSVSFISSFDSFYHFLLYTLNMFSIILSNVFYSFPSYSVSVFQVVHLLSLIAVFLLLFRDLPYHLHLTNTIHMAIVITEFLSDFFLFIFFLAKKQRFIILIIIIVVAIVGSTIGCYFFLKYQYEQVIKDLTPQDGEVKTENDYMAFYDFIGISEERKALKYLHIGLTEICPLFLNFTLIKYIINKHSNKREILSSLIQIISFFPSEYHLLNSLFIVLISQSDLSFYPRFLVYQVYRIKTLRQTTSIADANERLIKLRSLSEQCMSNVISFWNMREPNVAIFEALSREERRVHSLWVEAIRDYPNSAKLCDECATFLIECMCEFSAAIMMKQKCDMIESGHSFAVDAAFRCMIWSYPAYLKYGILDTKGNIVNNKGINKNNAKLVNMVNTEYSVGLSEMVETETNFEFEQKLGKQILNKSRLRLACDAALKKRTHPSFSSLPFLALLALVVGLIIYIAIFFFIKNSFYLRKDSVNYIRFLGLCHFHLRIANFMLITRFVIENHFVDHISDITEVNVSSITTKPYIIFDNNYVQFALEEERVSQDYFTKLVMKMNDIIQSSITSNDEVIPLIENLIDNTVAFYQCSNKQIIEPPVFMNFNNLLSYSFYLETYLISHPISYDLYNSDHYCSSVENQISILSKITSVYEGFIDYAVERNEALHSENEILMIVLPIILFIFGFIPYLICSLLYVKHVDKISSFLIGLDREVKEEAAQSIRKDIDISFNSHSEPHIGVPNITPITILLFFLALFSALICFSMLIYANSKCELLNNMNIWNYYAVLRLTNSIDLITQVYHVVILKSVKSYFITQEDAKILANNSFKDMSQANYHLLRGGSFPAIFGFDNELDLLNYHDSCQMSGPTTNFHDAYKCASCDKLVATINDLLQGVILYPNSTSNYLDTFDLPQMMHLMNWHFWERCEKTVERISQLADNQYNGMMTNVLVFLFIGVILLVLVFAGGFILMFSASNSYKAMLSEMKRIPPHLIVADKNLKNFLLNKNEEVDSMTSASRNALHSSPDALLCVSLEGVIDMVNPAVTTILGFTPEQLLGQPVDSFFSEEDAEKLINEMNIIIEGQNGCVYEDRMQCITDNSTLIPVQTTLLGMQQSDGLSTTSFVIILRNETELIKRQQAAEEAKAKSENLLYHILPQNVVMMLNRGEKDICITVPCATICFIDVVKFSDFTKNLQPQEIMGSLAHLFSSFDYLLNSYPLILKIKLIGDIYMAAAGLFTDGEKPEEHANQTVKFGLEALLALDDINVKLDANLQVRIGINTGGPIIAGVLGIDKPVFDIIGDTINVAARLQTTDIPGNIQTTQSTYELLEKDSYAIEQRGEVFLKGKGQVMTYLISTDILPPSILANNPM